MHIAATYHRVKLAAAHPLFTRPRRAHHQWHRGAIQYIYIVWCVQNVVGGRNGCSRCVWQRVSHTCIVYGIFKWHSHQKKKPGCHQQIVCRKVSQIPGVAELLRCFIYIYHIILYAAQLQIRQRDVVHRRDFGAPSAGDNEDARGRWTRGAYQRMSVCVFVFLNICAS